MGPLGGHKIHMSHGTTSLNHFLNWQVHLNRLGAPASHSFQNGQRAFPPEGAFQPGQAQCWYLPPPTLVTRRSRCCQTCTTAWPVSHSQDSETGQTGSAQMQRSQKATLASTLHTLRNNNHQKERYQPATRLSWLTLCCRAYPRLHALGAGMGQACHIRWGLC